jgi:membrane protein YdbS with pleckstrin-like domain
MLRAMEGQQPLNWDWVRQPVVVRQHRLTLVSRLVPRVLLAALALTAFAGVGALNGVTALIVLAVVGASMTAVWARWRCNTFTLAPPTMMLRSGLVHRSCRVIPTAAVQDVTSRQSPLGFLLGYGTVEIMLRAGPVQRFTSVHDPEGLRDRIHACREYAVWR